MDKSLPFLPGNSFHRPKLNNHLSHQFDTVGEVSIELKCTKDQQKKNYVEGKDQLPAWLAYDKQVLCFDGYFHERLTERAGEPYRVRSVKLLYYLEDGCIQIDEPRTKDAGYPQGTILKRQKVENVNNPNKFLTYENLRIGTDVLVKQWKIRIVNCDKFTREFYQKKGFEIGTTELVPTDPYNNRKKTEKLAQKSLRPYERMDTLKQFLDHDRQVLRLWAVWDDTDQLHGDLRKFVINYYLSDDTIELKEILAPNCGRDQSAVFLKRSRLPKKNYPLPPPGKLADRTVLNVIGGLNDSTFILDNLKTGTANLEYYTEKDLVIGQYINVWTRRFFIVDCDDFTKNYYSTKYGIQKFPSLIVKGKNSVEPIKIEKEIPPYNGWGSYEDSLNSTLSLLPQPPKKDFKKFMLYDKLGYDSGQLRFLAKLNSNNPIQKKRRFVIIYYLSDDTIQVFEKHEKNSGIDGGKFLERCRAEKPNQMKFHQDPKKYFTINDIFIGGIMTINSHSLLVIDADEYALQYMEKLKLPMSNIARILSICKQHLSSRYQEMERLFAEYDVTQSGLFTYETFSGLLKKLTENKLSEHEILSVARQLNSFEETGFDLKKFLLSIQSHFRRMGYNDFDILKKSLLSRLDNIDEPYLSQEMVRKVLKSNHVPFPPETFEQFIFCMTLENNQLNAFNIVNALDWVNYPIQKDGENMTIDQIKNENEIEEILAFKNIHVNYLSFLQLMKN
ncbi:hypothetical protein SNEBB_005276 [Seison nebaliae]|nr:hypothetical protein SNEBB_005276 [Seison nebaliae]